MPTGEGIEVFMKRVIGLVLLLCSFVMSKPVARHDFYIVEGGSTKSVLIDFQKNDYDTKNRPFKVIGTTRRTPAGNGRVYGQKYLFNLTNENFRGFTRIGYLLQNDQRERSNIGIIYLKVINPKETGTVKKRTIARPDSYSLRYTDERVKLSLNVLGNDSDEAQRRFWLHSITKKPSKGTVKLDAGKIVFESEISQTGEISFSYNLKNEDDEISNSAVVKINLIKVEPPVVPENKAPIARSDSYQISNTGHFEYNLLSNDTDPEGKKLTLVSVSGERYGTVSITGEGLLHYELSTESAQNRVERLSYVIKDEEGASSSGQVEITILAKKEEIPEEPSMQIVEFPLHFHFIHYDQSTKVSETPQEDARALVDDLNKNLKKNGNQLIKFKLVKVKEHFSPNHHIMYNDSSGNDDIYAVRDIYADPGVMNIIGVKSVSGGQSGGTIGQAFTNVTLRAGSKSATGVFNMDYAMGELRSGRGATLVHHEIAHTLGAQHSVERSGVYQNYRGAVEYIGEESVDGVNPNRYILSNSPKLGNFKYYQRYENSYARSCENVQVINGKEYDMVKMAMRWHVTRCVDPNNSFFVGAHSPEIEKVFKRWVEYSLPMKVQ